MKGLLRTVLPVVFLLAAVMVNPTAQAAKACKGMNKAQCSADAACTWVSSYTTKSGKKVASYCRVKSGKKSVSSKASGKSGTEKKADKAKKQTKEQKTAKTSSKKDSDKAKKTKQDK